MIKKFKLDAISLILKQGYSHAFRGDSKLTSGQEAIRRLKEENKRLKMEKDILKKRRSSLSICRFENAMQKLKMLA